MPYSPEGNTPLLPALAGLASAYFNIKNQLAQQKTDKERTAQEVSASKTNQAATRVQNYLGPDDKQLPMPSWSSPVAGTAAAAANAPSSGSPATATPDYYRQQADMWDQRSLTVPPGSPPYQFAIGQRDYNRSMIGDAGKSFIVVKGPDGQPMMLPFSDYYNKNTPNYGETHVSPTAVYNKRTVSADTKYREQHVPAGTVYSQGQENARAQQREKFDFLLRQTPTADAQWNHSAQGPKDALSAARTADRENTQWYGTTLRTMNAQNDATIKDGKTPPNQNMGAFEAGLNKLLDAVKRSPTKEASLVQQVQGLGTLSDSQRAVAIEMIHRTANAAKAMGDAQRLLDVINKQYGGSNANANPPSPWR